MATKSAIINIGGEQFRATWDTFNNQYGWGAFNFRWFVISEDRTEYLGDFGSIREFEDWQKARA